MNSKAAVCRIFPDTGASTGNPFSFMDYTTPPHSHSPHSLYQDSKELKQASDESVSKQAHVSQMK